MSVSRNDLLIKNANIITSHKDNPFADTLVIRNGRIMAIGREADLQGLAGNGTKVLNCQGRTVLPGFIDSHVHLLALASSTLDIDVRPSTAICIDDILGAIETKAQEAESGEWIRAFGYHEFFLREKRHPTRWELDRVAPGHPVRLLHHTRHACVLNSKALDLAGIDRFREGPPGSLVERDPQTDEPNGVVYGMNQFLARNIIPAVSEAEITEGLRVAVRRLYEAGVTSVHDATVRNGLKDWTLFKELAASGESLPNIYLMIGLDSLKVLKEEGLGFFSGDDRLRLGAVKLAINEIGGKLSHSAEEIKEQIGIARREGFPVAVHAMEEPAIEQVIQALEKVYGARSGEEHRTRVEHIAVCPPDLLPRLSRLGAIAVPDPAFILYSGDRYIEEIDEARLAWLYRGKSFVSAGVRLAFGSDAPVVPAKPLEGIISAVIRRTGSGAVISEKERLGVRESIEAFTKGGAYASFQENTRGSLAPGKVADFVILNNNPLTVHPDDLSKVRVTMTVKGGEIVWDEDGR